MRIFGLLLVWLGMGLLQNMHLKHGVHAGSVTRRIFLQER